MNGEAVGTRNAHFIWCSAGRFYGYVWYVIRLDCSSFCMLPAAILPYPFWKVGGSGGEGIGAHSNRSLSTYVPLRDNHSSNMFDMTSWWLPQPWGISMGMTPYPHSEFCFHKSKPPTPSRDGDGFISKIRACLNAVKLSPGCPHCSAERSGQTHFIRRALPWHINYTPRPCIPQLIRANFTNIL